MRPESQEAEKQQVKRVVPPQGPPVLRPSLMSLQLLAPRHQGWGERSLAPWPTWSLEKVGHSSPKDACESKHASVHVAHCKSPAHILQAPWTPMTRTCVMQMAWPWWGACGPPPHPLPRFLSGLGGRGQTCLPLLLRAVVMSSDWPNALQAQGQA